MSSSLVSGGPPASQTLVRGLDVLEQVATEPMPLAHLAERLGLSRSTVHRLATTLLERRYLNFAPRRGYTLGPKLLELGTLVREQINLVRVAQPALAALAEHTGEVALLGVRDGGEMLLADRAGGRRALAPTIRAGQRQPLATCALGQALLLDDPAPAAEVNGAISALRAEARATGLVRDLGVLDPEIATLAAPVRDADGAIRAAVAVTTARAYLTPALAEAAAAAVREAAEHIAAELGWHVGALPAEQAGAPDPVETASDRAEPAERNLLNSAATSSPPAGRPPQAAAAGAPMHEVKRFAMKGRKA